MQPLMAIPLTDRGHTLAHTSAHWRTSACAAVYKHTWAYTAVYGPKRAMFQSQTKLNRDTQNVQSLEHLRDSR